jgi:hypothetical protein
VGGEGPAAFFHWLKAAVPAKIRRGPALVTVQLNYLLKWVLWALPFVLFCTAYAVYVIVMISRQPY